MNSCFRRSLCYPLYRSWKLATTVWTDVKVTKMKNVLFSKKKKKLQILLKSGRRGILKVLLELKLLLERSERRDLLSKYTKKPIKPMFKTYV